MACEFDADGISRTKGKIYCEGQFTFGAIETPSDEMANCTICIYFDGGSIKLKHKDSSGTVTVYTLDSNPPGFQPTP